VEVGVANRRGKRDKRKGWDLNKDLAALEEDLAD